MDRTAQIKQVVGYCLGRWVPGQQVGEEDIRQLISSHPDLMPELAEELHKVRRIAQAAVDAFAPSGARGAAGPPADPGAATTLRPVPPVVLPDYDLLHPIGCGGFGAVWLGCNRHNGQFYAVKLLSAPGAVELDGIRAYKQRVHSHPHLVPIEHVGVVGSWLYYTMPLADDAKGAAVVRMPADYEALTLQGYLQRHAPLPLDEVLAVADQLLAALEHLHAADLLHRDVKPGNVLRMQGVWRLGDMGLLTPGDRSEPDRGTRAFWPPERPRDRTADLYALGKTLYLALTAARPLTRTSSNAS
jgi:serine/threonine protein kinase